MSAAENYRELTDANIHDIYQKPRRIIRVCTAFKLGRFEYEQGTKSTFRPLFNTVGRQFWIRPKSRTCGGFGLRPGADTDSFLVFLLGAPHHDHHYQRPARQHLRDECHAICPNSGAKRRETENPSL